MAAFNGWLGNRADSPAQIEVTDELAREFLASKYSAHPLLSQGLTLFVAAGDGKNLAWEPRDDDNNKAIGELYQRVRRLQDERKDADA